MAKVLPSKRPRELSHRHQLSVDSVAPRSKRSRLSLEPSIEPSDLNDTADDRSTAPVETEAESDEDEDEDAHYFRATQAVEKSFRKVTDNDNTPAEHGIIEEIGCTNFMCHEQLTVRLGPLINFIIGHNGSGKSAVLTALTLCLGGKATATNRGQSLKSFIKAGKDWSTLSVKIKNQGSGAYKPEQYGDSIIVERHFTQSGTSGFKLKDRNGRIVSTKKSELEDIIDHFGLQIDNPLNVLTQDMARQFLNDSNAKDKYKFFLKGTQLETLDRDYSQIQQELEEQMAKHKTLDKDLKELERRYSQLDKKARYARGLSKLRAEEETLVRQGAWAYVVGDEQEAAAMDEQIQNLSDTIGERQAEADIASEEFAAIHDEVNAAKMAVEQCQAELQPARDEESEAKANFDEARKKLFDFKSNERNMAGAISKTKRSMEDTQSQIDEHKQRRERADGGLHQQKVHELEEAKTAFEECKSAWESHSHNLPTLNKELDEAKEQLQRSTARLDDKRKEEKHSRDKIRNLQQGQRKWTDAYPNGPNLERLIQAIEAESRFRERPVGPVGRFVALKDPKWSSILEKSLGQALNAFVVTNKFDHGILSEMMRKLNYNAPVNIVDKTDRIDTTGKTPESGLLTTDRVMNISHDLVRNVLIANQYIEQTVLIRNRQEASQLAHRPERARPNVKFIYCWSDQSNKIGHHFQMNNRTGTTSMSAIQEYRGMSRMQADKGHQIEEEKESLERILREVGDLDTRVQAAQRQTNACQAKIRDYNTVKKNLKQQMDRAQDQVDILDGEVAAAVPDTAQLEQLEKELEDFEEQLKLDEEQMQDLVSENAHVGRESKEHKRKVEQATQAVKDLEAKLEQCKANEHTLKQKREQALRRKNKAIEQVQEAGLTRANWQERRDELQVQLDVHIEDAQNVCERVDVPRGATYESLMRKLADAQKRRADLEKELGGSQEELVRQALAARKTWQEAKIFVENGERLRTSLANALDHRKEHWRHFRNDISVRARITFNYLLSERMFRGELLVDHNRKALDMNVQPDKHVKDNAKRQTKTLSGGEKSFSTICLLLALWDAMGSPIRCLDEFDVFMDSVNRDISMDMIITAARRAVGRQYILITPQAMNNKSVKSMQDVTVIKMSDPERGQTALNFGQ